MKFLIWFICIFANAIITVIIRNHGIILGALPAMVLYGLTFWLARTLCRKWDDYKWNNKNKPTVATTANRGRFVRNVVRSLLKTVGFVASAVLL